MFTLVLAISGVGAILYGLGAMVEFVVGGQLSGVFRRRAMRRQVERLEDHYIICGYGRVGETVARHLAAGKAPLVAVDNHPSSLSRAEGSGALESRVEGLHLAQACCAVGRSIEDLEIRTQTGSTIVATGTPAQITQPEGLVGVPKAAKTPER